MKKQLKNVYKKYFKALSGIFLILFIFNIKGYPDSVLSHDGQSGTLPIEKNISDRFISKEEMEILLQTEAQGEGFRDFFEQFVKDPAFQISRVKFPVGERAYKMKKNSSYKNPQEDPDFDLFWNDFVTYEMICNDNWIKLEAATFIIHPGTETVYPSGWIYYDHSAVAFLQGFLFSDDFNYMLNFRKEDGKWYLTEYKDGKLYTVTSDK